VNYAFEIAHPDRWKSVNCHIERSRNAIINWLFTQP